MYKEVNKGYLTKGEFYGRDKIPLSHGFYEPNIFRRKILKEINEKSNANINKIDRYLQNECAKDYDLNNFDFKNVKRDINLIIRDKNFIN